MKVTFKLGKEKHTVGFQQSTSINTHIIVLPKTSKDLDVMDILTKDGDDGVIEGIKLYLEKKIKTKININYNYQGAGYGFDIDMYEILNKLK
jgi:hypothetical protein|tara:strand:- start:187 stop:462 length:276 start_codon:yes stop_codon:yes gene_type:complete